MYGGVLDGKAQINNTNPTHNWYPNAPSNVNIHNIVLLISRLK